MAVFTASCLLQRERQTVLICLPASAHLFSLSLSLTACFRRRLSAACQGVRESFSSENISMSCDVCCLVTDTQAEAGTYSLAHHELQRLETRRSADAAAADLRVTAATAVVPLLLLLRQRISILLPGCSAADADVTISHKSSRSASTGDRSLERGASHVP